MIVRNFLFHRVSPERDPLWDPIDPRSFEKILRHLTRRYRIVGLEDWFLHLDAQDSRAAPPVCTVGFDDGYRDNLEYAVPLLKRYGCPASFYVVTDCVDDQMPTWTYQVDYLLRQTGAEELRLESDHLPEALREARFRTDADRLDFAVKLKPQLKRLSNTERIRVLEELKRSLDDVAIPGDLMMSWDDLRSLVGDGFILGSHTKTHAMLASIDDRPKLQEELELSRDRIRDETGVEPIAISYPIGSVNEMVVDQARRSGYRLGLATGQRVCTADAQTDVFRIPRIELYNESWWKTRARISGHLETIKRLVRH